MIKQRLIGRSNLRVKLRDDIVIEKFKSGDQDAHLYIGCECNFLRKRGLSKEVKLDAATCYYSIHNFLPRYKLRGGARIKILN